LPKSPGVPLLITLTCIMGAGPLMTYGLSATSPLIINDLGLGESQFGLLATLTFFAAAAGSTWLGRLSDRITGKAQLLIIFGGAAFGLALAGMTRSYIGLVAAVVVAGMAQAITNPTSNRLIMSHVPPRDRALWIGIKQSGVQGSQLFSGLFFAPAALLVGWHGAVGLAAAIALGLLLWAWNRVPEEPAIAPPAHGIPSPQPAPAEPGRMPATVWLYAAYALLTGIGIQATNVYLPLFAQRELGFSLVAAGMTVAASGIIGVCSRVFLGRLAGPRSTMLLLLQALGAVLGAAVLLLSASLQFSPALWIGVALHGAMGLGVNVAIMAGVTQAVAPGRVGAATGVVSLGMYLGFGLGPLGMGLLLEAFGSFFAGWLLVGTAYMVGAVLAAYRMLRRPR